MRVNETEPRTNVALPRRWIPAERQMPEYVATLVFWMFQLIGLPHMASVSITTAVHV